MSKDLLVNIARGKLYLLATAINHGQSQETGCQMQDGSTAADATEELKAALAELLLLQLIEAGDALTADVPPAETAKPRRASRLIRSELVSA